MGIGRNMQAILTICGQQGKLLQYVGNKWEINTLYKQKMGSCDGTTLRQVLTINGQQMGKCDNMHRDIFVT